MSDEEAGTTCSNKIVTCRLVHMFQSVRVNGVLGSTETPQTDALYFSRYGYLI